MNADSTRPVLNDLVESYVHMRIGFGLTAASGRLVSSAFTAGAPHGSLEVGGRHLTRTWHRRPHAGFPDYETLWPVFERDVEGVFEASGTDPAIPDVSDCELCYANPVTQLDEEPRVGRLDRVLLGWAGHDPATSFLSPPEDLVVDSRYSIPPVGTVPPGTLSMQMRAVSTETPEPAIAMTFRAWAPVPDGTLHSVHDFFDTAFGWIVRGFASLAVSACPDAHESAGTRRRRGRSSA